MFAVGMVRKFRVRLGDLWWYTLLLFAAQRLGDVINMFVGLWLVPKYVPQSELGAVLPLSQFVSFIGIPLAIVATPFSKFLLDYGARGEYGKIKSLVRDVFICTGCLALLTLLFAYVCLPFLFARMRVPVGSLGVLIVAVSILSSVSSVFSSAVQGLKLYSATVLFNVLAAPLRLVLMLVFMPFRPLSGYFVGQGDANEGYELGGSRRERRRGALCAAQASRPRRQGRSISQGGWTRDGAVRHSVSRPDGFHEPLQFRGSACHPAQALRFRVRRILHDLPFHGHILLPRFGVRRFPVPHGGRAEGEFLRRAQNEKPALDLQRFIAVHRIPPDSSVNSASPAWRWASGAPAAPAFIS